MRNLCFSLLTSSVLFTANAQALPIVNADAFTTGDGKAVYETTSGLTWLDFGINNSVSFNQVTEQLGTGPYAGWRLPTEAEVLHLFKGLLIEFTIPDALPPTPPRTEWSELSQPVSEQTQLTDLDLHWSDIFSLWGVNAFSVGAPPTFSYENVGSFLSHDGVIFKAEFRDFIFSTDTPGGIYYGQILQFNVIEQYDGYEEAQNLSTLLVRDTPLAPVASVPEPGIFALFTLGFGGLLLNRLRRRTRHSKS